MNKYYKNIIIGVIIFAAMFLLIGASYAFFTARIIGNEDAELMKLNSGTIELTFVDNNTINLSNAKPGDSESKTFTVENTGTFDDDYTYNIKLVDVETSFLKRDLKYTLEECNDNECTTPKENGLKEEGYITTDSVKNGEMYLALNIPRPEKKQLHYYKLTIEFINLENENQNYNQGAIFNGKINVDAEEGMELYSKPNAPELYQGLIPVKYDEDGTIRVADPEGTDWYNYENKEWANAVLVTDAKYKELTENNKIKDDAVGTQLKLTTDSTSDILQMYVWIPRYKYQLFNAKNGSIDPMEIKIRFEYETESTGSVSCEISSKGVETCENAENGNWFTHPAFKFGNTDLTGIWVGKFEPSHTTKSKSNGSTDASAVLNCANDNCVESNNIRIVPNVPSLRYNTISNFFYVSRSLEKVDNIYNLDSYQIDTHMMKNMEWGAMAYLTHSRYGRCDGQGECTEVVMNSRSDFITGYNGTTNTWNTTEGQKASTTGNLYGIYDTNGGSWEYMMSVTMDSTGSAIEYSNSGFSAASLQGKEKYYEIYEYDTVETSHRRGHLGDATRETLKTFGNNFGGWYDDGVSIPFLTISWFERSGCYWDNSGAGTFAFHHDFGKVHQVISFRVVLTAKDGDK